MHAFGLTVTGADALAGLVPGPDPEGGRRVAIERLPDDDAVAARWPEPFGAGAEDDGPLVVRADPRAGWLAHVPGLGTHVLSADGMRLAGHVPSVRLLHAQTLPLAATLQGLELLHASAVALAGRAVALVAAAGTGKSSVAAHLVAHGAAFVTDDALALEPAGDGVRAHPGARLAGVPPEQGLDLGPVREDVDKPLVEPSPAADRALPLGAVVVLDRDPGHRSLDLAPEPRPLPLVLAAGFVPYVTGAERHRRLLATAAAVAAAVPVARLTVPPHAGAADVARLVADRFGAA